MAKKAVVIADKVTRAQGPAQAPRQTKPVPDPNLVADIYLITKAGLLMLTGADGEQIRNKIEQNNGHSPSDYRFYDDDKHKWAYWAVDNDDTICPLTFPDIQQYSLTSSLLYTKAVTFSHTLAHAVGLLRQKPPTLWDKMLKPTTIIMAIVGCLLCAGILLLAAGG